MSAASTGSGAAHPAPRRGGPHRRGWGAAFAATCVVNVIGVYWPSQPGPEVGVAHVDKLVHVVLFAAVAVTGRRFAMPAVALSAVLLLHAISSEWVQQAWLARRSGDVVDAVCDGAGLAIGLVIARYWSMREARGMPSDGGDTGRSSQEGSRP